ncbi:MAG: flagellar assembly protein FliW [Mariprofundus sp.]|nr:flagellar assembly protein FliW [Mariprofundus sp.]
MTAALATQNIMVTETEREPQPSEAFYFPQGMAGFSETREFGFIYQGHGDIICIQSIDHPEAAFLITPWDTQRLGSVPVLSADQCKCIQITSQEQIMWMLVLNPFADEKWVTANLKAPVALNPVARIGLQSIRQEADLNIRFPWLSQPS